jgi:hypothetical protein
MPEVQDKAMPQHNVFHRQLSTPQLSEADAHEDTMLRRFLRWHDFVRAVRDAARRDDFSARLELALQQDRR